MTLRRITVSAKSNQAAKTYNTESMCMKCAKKQKILSEFN